MSGFNRFYLFFVVCFPTLSFAGLWTSKWPIYKQYSIVLSAGQNTTTILLYRYKTDPHSWLEKRNVTLVFNQTKSFGITRKIEEYKSLLKDLIRNAKVAKKYRSHTPIHYLITNAENMSALDIHNLLLTMRSYLKLLGYKIYAECVNRLIVQRAYYSWLAVNELLDRFRYKMATVSVLDLDEVYAHGALAVWNAENLEEPKRDRLVKWTVVKKKFDVLGESIKGLGLYEARSKILEKNKVEGQDLYKSVCVHPGVTADWVYNGKQYKIQGAEDKCSPPSVDIPACREVIKSILSTHKVEINLNGTDPYAVSMYNSVFNESGVFKSPRITVSELRGNQSEVCKIQDNSRPFVCMDIIYLNLLWRKVFGLHRDSVVTMVNEIKGLKATWEFGAAFDGFQRSIHMIP